MPLDITLFKKLCQGHLMLLMVLLGPLHFGYMNLSPSTSMYGNHYSGASTSYGQPLYGNYNIPYYNPNFPYGRLQLSHIGASTSNSRTHASQ